MTPPPGLDRERASPATWLFQSVLLPAYEGGLHRRRTWQYWRDLERTQWLSRPALEDLQLRSLQHLLQRAFVHSPYYRDRWRELDLRPAEFQSLEDLRRWPTIDRATIAEHRLRMRSEQRGTKLIAKSTGGSTGEPLRFDVTPDANDRKSANWHRGYSWAGAAPGTRQVHLWGVPLVHRRFWSGAKDRLYHCLYRRRVLNSFDFSEARVPEFLRELNRYRPDAIVAYTNPLYEFARALRGAGLRPFSPRSIIVGAEKLHDFQRRLIEDVFAAPVFETYGSREFTLMAAECDRHEGLHLSLEQLLIEILDDDGKPTADGEEGNVVVTDLHNHGMPFVRYVNGDRAVAGFRDCSCGRGLPLLKSVVGRQLDVVTTPDGRRVPGEFFPHLFKDFPAVRRFQVRQEAPGSIQVRIVPDATWTSDIAARIEATVRNALGPQMALDLVTVADIPLTASGKHQVVVRRLPPAAGDGVLQKPGPASDA